MRHAIFAVTVVLLAACGNTEREAVEEARRNAPKKADAAPAETVRKETPPAAAKQVEPEPDPTKPEQIDRARNQAMIDGRDKDVLKYCDLAKLDDKSNPQALLGCTLSACRLNDADTAKRYSKALPKLLMEQAKKVCSSQKVDL